MITQIAKWGNSLALRIPGAYAREVQITEGGSVDICVLDGKIVITPVETVPNYDLNQLLAEISPENLHGETDTGKPVGKESW